MGNMANMTPREKADHIWYYYKLHIIAGIFALIFLIYTISSIVNRTEYVFNVTLLDKYIDEPKLTAFQKEATEALVEQPSGRKEIQMDFLYYSREATDQMAVASLQKLAALIATGSIDLMAVDMDDFKNFAQQGAYLEIDKVPGMSGLLDSNVKLVTAKGYDGAEGAYGIDVSDLRALKDAGYDTENKVLCIMAGSKRPDKSVEFLEWLLNK